MPIRPSQLRERLQNLQVNLDSPNPPVSVSVTKYACDLYGGGQVKRKSYNDRLYHVARRDLLGMTNNDYVDVFKGKGTIENIQKVLRLAARHRIYFHDGPAAGPGPGLSVADGLRRVVDEYIGQDCNGFVGNWAILSGLPGASAGRPPLDWLDHGRVRESLDDVRAFDLVIWASGHHIAVIETAYPGEPGATRRDLYVGESADRGIQIHPYSIRRTRTTVDVRRSGRHFTSFLTVNASIHRDNPHVIILRPNGIST